MESFSRNAFISTFVSCTCNILAKYIYSYFYSFCVDSPVTISEHPRNQQVKLGGEAKLSVRASGTDIKYQWLRDDKSLANGALYQGSNSETLIIHKATSEDSLANFTCKISNKISTEKSFSASLDVSKWVILFSMHYY